MEETERGKEGRDAAENIRFCPSFRAKNVRKISRRAGFRL